jgi:hypothetical protein
VDQFFGLKQKIVFLLFGSQIRTGGTSKFGAQELDCPTFLISLLSNGMKLQTSEASHKREQKPVIGSILSRKYVHECPSERYYAEKY